MKTRRELLQSAGLAALASCTGAPPMTTPDEIPIVDTHQHLWDLSKLRVPWLKGGPLDRSFTLADYAEATRGLPIKAVYMEVDAEDKVAEADLVLSYCADPASPTKAAVLGGRLLDPGFPAYLDRFKGNPYVKGIRQVLHGANTPRGTCLKDDFVRSVRLLGSRDLSFDVCIRPGELDDASSLAALCPETRLILDHCGNADPKAFTRGVPTAYKRSLEALAARPNVYCKISGVIARVPKGAPIAEVLAPIVDTCLDTFGPDRVIFGSDWPVCLHGGALQDWVTALREITSSRPLPDRRKLWHANAERLYTL